MSKRLNQEREKELTPVRRQTAIDTLTELGYEVTKYGSDGLAFEYKGSRILYFPYSGWASGATIEDGRGLQNLLKQLKP